MSENRCITGHQSFIVRQNEKELFRAQSTKHAVYAVAEIDECGSMVNNTLTSPGYPDNYPSNMDCNYSVPIPQGMAMRITFHEFHMEYYSNCK